MYSHSSILLIPIKSGVGKIAFMTVILQSGNFQCGIDIELNYTRMLVNYQESWMSMDLNRCFLLRLERHVIHLSLRELSKSLNEGS